MPTFAERLQTLVGPGYRIERELPLGGMSRLYVARDRAVDRDVVVKVLPPDLACTASTVRFRREVELTAQLLHPNILPVLSAGGADDVLYYVTPFVTGESLRELLAREGVLPLDAVLRVLDDVLDALAHAHSRGVVHRDVKPGNILLAAGGRAMLADFGIARALSAADATGSEVVAGTLAYMAPEHPSDASADLWATCVVAHEMLAGARPSPGVAASDIVRARARVRGSADARRAAALAEVVARGLAIEPARRFANVEALRTAVTASRERRIVTRRRLVGAAGVALVALAGFAATRPSVEAARARERGRAAEARFELDAAIAAYREALAARSDDAESRLGLARALIWRNETTDLEQATQLLRGDARARDTSRDVAALAALASRRYPEACAAFARLIRRDSTDARAWMGLGECRRRDDAVLRDAASPTGYAFRTSYHGAADAYEHALDLAPAAALLYTRLRFVLVTESNRQRGGRLIGDSTTRLRAYPELDHDTVAFHPMRGIVGVPLHRNLALETNIERLRNRLATWAQSAPSDPAAARAYSAILEAKGYLSHEGTDDRSAISEIRRARALTPQDSALPLVLAEVRLLVKAGEWLQAARLADSALTRWRGARAEEADQLLGIAALTGRRARAKELARMVASTRKQRARLRDGRELELHEAVTLERAQLMAMAAMGACAEVPALLQRLRRSITSHVARSPDRAAIEQAVLERPLSLAVPCLGPQVMHDFGESQDLLVRLQVAASRHSRRDVARIFGTIDSLRQHDRPGDTSIDYAYHGAWVMASVGDSSAALTRLDIALDALSSSGPYLLTEMSQAAAVPQAMQLAARLAETAHDTVTARRWNEARAALLAHADGTTGRAGTREER